MHLSAVEPQGKNRNQTPHENFAPMTPVAAESRTTAQYALFEAIRHRRYRQAKLLVEAGLNIDSRNEKGETPLICSSTQVDDSKIRVKFAKLFLDAGANLNLQDWKGLTALMHASIQGQADLVLALLEHEKIDVGIKDQNGETALMYAARNGHTDVVAIFVNTFLHSNTYFNVEDKNNEGLTAMDLALKNGHEICAKLLTKQLSPPLMLQEVTSEDFVQTPSPVVEEKVEILTEQTEQTENLPALSEQEKIPNQANKTKVTNSSPEGLNGEKPKEVIRASSVDNFKTPRILPLLSLNHVGQIGKNLTPGDAWEWDLGAATARFKMVKYRPLDTGSRSLNESRGRLSDNLESLKTFSSTEQMTRDIRASSSIGAELMLKPPNTEVRLPPIGSTGSAYKKTLYVPTDSILIQEDSDCPENVATSA